MTTLSCLRLASSVLALLALTACSPGSSGGGSGGTGTATGGSTGTSTGGTSGAGTGGDNGASTTGGSGSGGQGQGSGGSTPGTGGATSGSGGASTGSGGSSGGSSGTSTGTGGASTGSGGAGTGSGGRAGTGGTAGTGTTGSGGMGGSGGGSTGSAGAGAGDSYVSNVSVTMSTKVNTILVVTWTQTKAADQVWLEFGFSGSDTMKSHAMAGGTGMHRDVVLGVPGSTMVTLRIVSQMGGTEYKTKDYTGTTGAVPSGMPASTVSMYDATKADPAKYMLGAVENSTGGCTSEACYFNATWWLFIMDRQGRIVWYYADGASHDVSSFPRAARDGEYLFVEKRSFGAGGTPSVLKMTLDRETYTSSVMIPLLSDCIDMTTDGTILYDTEERAHGNSELRAINRQGQDSLVWACNKELGTSFQCYSNTVTWVPETDSVLLSFPEEQTIAEIDRKNGTVVATYGARTGSYSFSPSPWSFWWQHSAVITPMGTLLVSSHLPNYDRFATAAPNHHAFEEFTIDRTAKRLTRTWLYGDASTDGPEWAYSRGEVAKLSNGNYLANYGTGGVIREVTPDKKTVFYVKFDVATGNDYYNKLVGRTFLVDELYKLNGGGPK